MTDLSIVIVNWNAGELVRRAIESVRDGARVLSAELIVVDNASTDGSARPLLSRSDGTRLIVNGDNVGFARACNQGMRGSRGRYVLLLNPDTVVLPGALETMVAFMDAHARVGAAGPALQNPDGSRQPSGGEFPSLRRLLAIHPVIAALCSAPEHPLRRRELSAVAEVDEVSGACMIVRRAAIDQVGLLDEAFFLYFEDVDWCLRLKRAGWKVYYVPAARVVHHWRSRTDPSPGAQVHHLRSRLYYVRKHFGLGPVLLLAAVSTGVYAGLLVRTAVRWLLRPEPAWRHDLHRYQRLLVASLRG